MNKKRLAQILSVAFIVVFVLANGFSVFAQGDPGDKGKPEWKAKVDPALLTSVSVLQGNEGVKFEVEFEGTMPDLSAAYNMSWSERGWYVYNTLSPLGDKHAQELRAQGLAAECLPWVCLVNGGMAEVEATAKIDAVTRVRPVVWIQLPPEEEPTDFSEVTPQSFPWGILKIRTPEVWGLGIDGSDVVIGLIDTGAQWDHPALRGPYRGTITGSHDYNWYDPSGVCPDPWPCDNVGHGTHTAGTAVGWGGIGVAPGATWIAAKGCETGWCSDYALLASAYWMLAPTKLDGSGADPDKRPHIVSNSWGGGGGDPWYQGAVDAWGAAGIIPVFAAGNSDGFGMNSPGDYSNVISAGATDVNDVVAWFSSRGPCPDGRICPTLVAPGVNVRSSVPGGYAVFSGTSMATPHVAGAIALICQANPGLCDGQFEAIRDILCQTADRLGSGWPNNNYGCGRINAYNSVLLVGGGHTGVVQGKVLDSQTGLPIAGAKVTASQGVYTLTTTSDSAGSYKFQLAAGEIFTLTASAWTYYPATTPAAAAEGTTVVMDIPLEREPVFSIVGTVFANDVNGAPASQPHATMSVIAGAPGKISVNTNPNGIYEIPGLPAGTYTLQASTSICTGSNAVVTTTVDVPTSGPVDLLLLGRPTYAVSQTAFNWIDVASSGIKLGASYYDDRWSPVTLAQPLSYWGRTISQIGVSSNGFVMTDLTNAVPLGSYFHPVLGRPIANGVVAPYWGDLDPGRSGDGSGVWALETADFVAVEWATYEYPGVSSGVWRRFEAILFRNGSIEFLYQDSPAGQRRWQTGVQGWSTSDLVLWGQQPSSGSALLWEPTLASCDVQSVSYLPIVAKAPLPTPTPDPWATSTPVDPPLPPWATDTPAPSPAP